MVYGQYTKPQIYSFSVVIPIISSFNSTDTLVTIKNNNQVVYSKKLSETPINIVSAQQAIIRYGTPEPIKALETSNETEKVVYNLYLIVSGIAVLAVLILIIFIKIRKPSVDTNNTSTPSPPPLP